MPPADDCAIEVRLEAAVDLAPSLSGFGRWGDDLLDRFDGRRLIRSVPSTSAAVAIPYVADISGGLGDVVHVRATCDAPAMVAAAIAATFVIEPRALEELAARDAAVARLAQRHPGLVPVLVPDPLHALVRSISAQQVNLRWAATIRHRLALRFGIRLEAADDAFVHVLDPDALAAATVHELRDLQLTNAKARSVLAVAKAARDGQLRIEELRDLTDEVLIDELTRLPGIGRWSAEWFLARTLGRPRVVAGDLAVRKAVGQLYGVQLPSEMEVRRLTEHWGEAATVVQALALHDLALSSGPAPAR